MSSCEKCWRAAGGNADAYTEIILSRPNCTAEEQAGPDATDCDKCERTARHQHTGECMACGDYPRMAAAIAARGAR